MRLVWDVASDSGKEVREIGSNGKRIKPIRATGKRVDTRSRIKRITGIGWACRFLTAAFSLLLGVSLWQYGSYVLENYRNKTYMEGVQQAAVKLNVIELDGSGEEEEESETPPIEVDFASLQRENPDVVAWIYCPDTKVNYPVLQSDDNNYYLRRRTDGSYLLAGSIFMDYRNADDFSDENMVLYGHNMKDGSMFGILPSYAQQEFYEEHPVWYLLTPEKNYKVELFAGFVTSTSSQVYSTKQEGGDDYLVMDKAWEDSDFRGGDPPKEREKTLTLSTCSYEFTDARYVLIGVLKEIGKA